MEARGLIHHRAVNAKQSLEKYRFWIPPVALLTLSSVLVVFLAMAVHRVRVAMPSSAATSLGGWAPLSSHELIGALGRLHAYQSTPCCCHSPVRLWVSEAFVLQEMRTLTIAKPRAMNLEMAMRREFGPTGLRALCAASGALNATVPLLYAHSAGYPNVLWFPAITNASQTNVTHRNVTSPSALILTARLLLRTAPKGRAFSPRMAFRVTHPRMAHCVYQKMLTFN